MAQRLKYVLSGLLVMMVEVCPTGALGATPPLDLAGVVRLALEHQPKVAAAESTAKAAARTADEQAAALRPQVSLRAADLFTGTHDGELDFISRDAPREAVGQAVVDQVLYDREATQRTRAAEADAAAVRAGSDVTRLDVAEAAADAFYTVLARRAAVQVWETSRREAAKEEAATRAAVSAGTRARLDLLRSRLVLQEAEQGLAVARAEEATASERLRLLTGLKALPELADPGPPEPDLELPPLRELTERAARNQPRLQQLRSAADRDMALLAAARGRRWPRARVEAAGGWDTAALPWRVDPGWSAGLYLSMPLFSGGGIRAGEEAGRYRVEAAQAALQQAELDLGVELGQARGKAVAALAEYRAAAATLATRREIASISAEGFRAGRLSSLDLAVAEEHLVKGRLDRVSAAARVRLALTRLDLLTGELPARGAP